jgi:outer membrane protein OmpA-like peptidoglycan-associated protein
MMICLVILVMGGCSQPPKQQVQPPAPSIPVSTVEEALKWARENFSTLEKLQVQEVYTQDFQKAREDLVRAENLLQENLYEDAYNSALASVASSQRILQQFHQETIAPMAQKTKEEIQAIISDDPDNPLKEFLPEINQILDYSDILAAKQQDVDVEKVLADLEKIKHIQQTTHTTVRQTLESDISFDPGQYELSDKGKQLLDLCVQKIVGSQKEYADLYPDSPVVTKIKVIGYSDQVGFNFEKGVKKLIEGVERENIPRGYPEKRKFLNQRLSALRARKVSEYLAQLLVQQNPQGQVEQEISGLGEELPPGITAPYPIEDARRRICKIYGYVVGQ